VRELSERVQQFERVFEKLANTNKQSRKRVIKLANLKGKKSAILFVYRVKERVIYNWRGEEQKPR